MNLQLRLPERSDQEEFLRAYEATRVSHPNFAHFYSHGMDFNEWLGILEQRRQGIGLEPGLGPSFIFLGWVDGRVVGRLTFRHSIAEPLLRVRGHIGYVVLPDQRRRGYATEMLRLVLPIARAAGLDRVLLTCDPENDGSRRTIELCGGVLEGTHEIVEDSASRMLNQYWIDLTGN